MNSVCLAIKLFIFISLERVSSRSAFGENVIHSKDTEPNILSDSETLTFKLL
jgi:hypothetical protein